MNMKRAFGPKTNAKNFRFTTRALLVLLGLLLLGRRCLLRGSRGLGMNFLMLLRPSRRSGFGCRLRVRGREEEEQRGMEQRGTGAPCRLQEVGHDGTPITERLVKSVEKAGIPATPFHRNGFPQTNPDLGGSTRGMEKMQGETKTPRIQEPSQPDRRMFRCNDSRGHRQFQWKRRSPTVSDALGQRSKRQRGQTP
jgi:hypothetical protein